MDLTLAILNIPICLALLHRCMKSLSGGLNGLLPILLVIFVVTNCVGLSLIKVVLTGAALKTGNVDLPFESANFAWQCAAHWVFMAMGYLVLWSLYRPLPGVTRSAGTGQARWFMAFAATVFTGGVIFYIPYMVLGPGFELLQGAQLLHFDFDDAADHRREMLNSLAAGQGYFRAQIAANGLFPLTAFFILFSAATSSLRVLLTGICFGLSLGFALCLRQKAPLVVCCLSYAALLLFKGRSGQFWDSKLPQAGKKHWVALMLTSMLILGGLYWAMEGGDVVDAVEKVLLRNFVAPAATSHIWFYVFPDRFDYRGFLDSLYVIPASVSKDGITIEDVAARATGFEFIANASLVSIGWSGLGMTGVLLASFCFYATVVWLDSMIRGMPADIQLGVMALSISSIVQLTSCSYGDFVMGGSLIAVMVACFAFKFTETGNNSNASRSRFAFYSTR